MPRPNGYQSLHTSVISEHGFPFEVQIRTEEMHRRAEEGIAAHWKYKEGRVGDHRDERYFQWMRQLLEVQQEVRDPQEFLQNLKIDLYPGGGLHLHAEGRGPLAAARRDRRRLRVQHSHRRRQPVRRRAHQRPDGAAAHPPAERRHRRDRHAGRAQAEPRLADVRRHLARAQQDQARAAGRGARRAASSSAGGCSRRRRAASVSIRRRCSRARSWRSSRPSTAPSPPTNCSRTSATASCRRAPCCRSPCPAGQLSEALDRSSSGRQARAAPGRGRGQDQGARQPTM